MKNDFYFPSADGVTMIHASEWTPEGEVRAVLQISHGMVEHIGRYDEFARYLNGFGIYVVGADHLGHGLSVTDKEKYGYFAHPNGNECVIADLHALREKTMEKYPGIPYLMMGHSMGSFLMRQYMMMHGEGLSGAIVMGTGSQPAVVLKLGKALCRLIAAVRGWQYRSTLVHVMAFASNNKKFEPARTQLDWLSRDEKDVDEYLADPMCGYVFTVNGFYQMFRGIEYIQNRKHIAQTPKDYPILLVSGAQDPVGGFGKGVQRAYEDYHACGVEQVTIKLYPEDRHELLAELDRQTVFEDLKNWLLDRIA